MISRKYKIINKFIDSETETNKFYVGNENIENHLLFFNDLDIYINSDDDVEVTVYESLNGIDYKKTYIFNVAGINAFTEKAYITGDYFYLSVKPINTNATINLLIRGLNNG